MAVQVDGHHLAPGIRFDIRSGAVIEDARAVHEDVDPAARRNDLGRALPGDRRGCGVARDGEGADRSRRIGGPILVQIVDRDRGAFGRQLRGYGKADAGSAAGDDRDLAFEPLSHRAGLSWAGHQGRSDRLDA